MAPTQDFVELVLRDTDHQVCANDAAAHPTTAQKRETTEHLALGELSPYAERLSNSLSELLVVGHKGFRSRTCKWILIRARAVDGGNWNIKQAQVYKQLSSMVIPVIKQERSQDCSPGRREQLSFTGHESPRCGRALVGEICEV
jgi:hypothetical protein